MYATVTSTTATPADGERGSRGYEPEPPPELYSVDGAVPPGVLLSRAEWLRRNPAHPGDAVLGFIERTETSVPSAAARIGVEAAHLESVIACREPVTLDLALRLEAAGWDTAERWLRWQLEHDLAAVRSRRTGALVDHDAAHAWMPRGIRADRYRGEAPTSKP